MLEVQSSGSTDDHHHHWPSLYHDHDHGHHHESSWFTHVWSSICHRLSWCICHHLFILYNSFLHLLYVYRIQVLYVSIYLSIYLSIYPSILSSSSAHSSAWTTTISDACQAEHLEGTSASPVGFIFWRWVCWSFPTGRYIICTVNICLSGT